MGSQQIALPVRGMTCESCAAQVRQALQGVDAVSQVNVDLAAEQAIVAFDEQRVEAQDLVDAVRQIGYEIALERVVLHVGGMTCVACMAHVEGALAEVLGVVEVNVKLATEEAEVLLVQGALTSDQLAHAVVEAGYRVLKSPA